MSGAQAAPPEEAPLPRMPKPLSLLWGGAVSVALLGAIGFQMAQAAPEALQMLRELPLSIIPVFAALYMVQPLADYAIYRRIWGLPLTGLGALIRKTALNEAVLDYTGEAYLYMWARERPGLAAPPFASIRDVNIISATVGFLGTLAAVAVAAAVPDSGPLPALLRPYLLPLAGVICLALGGLFLGRRVLALGARDLIYVSGVHILRMIAWCALTVAIWTLAVPGTRADAWIPVLAVALVTARVPFISNRNLLVSNVVLMLMGPHARFALVLADIALATLAAHLLAVLSLVAFNLVRRNGRARAGT